MVGFSKAGQAGTDGPTRVIWHDGNRLFVAAGSFSADVVVYDIAKNGALTKRHQIDTNEPINSLWSDGNRLYVANSANGLRVFDVAANGKLTETEGAGGSAQSVWLNGDRLYVGSLRDIVVYQVGRQGSLTELDRVTTGKQISRLWSDGERLLASKFDGGVYLYDIEADGGLHQLSQLAVKGRSYTTWTDGEKLFVAAGFTGVLMYDIMPDGTFAKAGTIRLGPAKTASDVWFDSGKLFIAAQSSLYIYERSDVGKFVRIGEIATDGTVWSVRVEGNQVFVADYENGVAVYTLDRKGPNFLGSESVDYFDGTAGADLMKGMAGNDSLDGKAGDDILVGGRGADKLIGGKGRDTASYEDAAARVVVNLANPKKNKGEATGDSYSSIENLTGSKFADKLIGDAKANVIKGGDGNDILIGGAGKDTLTGGKGADSFVFRSVNDSPSTKKSWDVITDFRSGQGDRIDLSAIDARAGTPKNDAFTFIGKDAFSGTKGELRFDGSKKKTFVYGDVNGDGKADFKIELTGKIDLKEDDFVL